MGGKWGEFEGKLCDRITKAFDDKDWKSYDHLDYYVWAKMPDHKGALMHYDSHFEDMARIYPYLNLTLSKYVSEYDQKLAENPIVDLGFRFTWGLAGLDHVLSTDPQGILPHQTIPQRYLVYAKSLGYGGGSLGVADPFVGCDHEAVGGAIPQYLFDQLPEGRYTPGKMISRYVYGYDSDMNKLNLTIWLNGNDIAF